MLHKVEAYVKIVAHNQIAEQYIYLTLYLRDRHRIIYYLKF